LCSEIDPVVPALDIGELLQGPENTMPKISDFLVMPLCNLPESCFKDEESRMRRWGFCSRWTKYNKVTYF
jgi:hypothetical protein